MLFMTTDPLGRNHSMTGRTAKRSMTDAVQFRDMGSPAWVWIPEAGERATMGDGSAAKM